MVHEVCIRTAVQSNGGASAHYNGQTEAPVNKKIGCFFTISCVKVPWDVVQGNATNMGPVELIEFSENEVTYLDGSQCNIQCISQ